MSSLSSNVLEKIVAGKKKQIARQKSRVSVETLENQIAAAESARGFCQRIELMRRSGQAAVIAECKKASPSKGVMRADYRPASIAKSYAKNGAACLSVLTDEKFFQGSPEHLQQAKSACALPVLRKDFMIDPYQVYEARAMGADCILLIVALLNFEQLRNLGDLALALGMDVLVEVHSKVELQLALELPYRLIGINNRNLKTFHTSIKTSIKLRQLVPSDRILVSESGIHSSEDVEQLMAVGIDVFLVGESFMRAEDPGAKLSAIFGTQQQR